jgi:hypothetical protein
MKTFLKNLRYRFHNDLRSDLENTKQEIIATLTPPPPDC